PPAPDTGWPARSDGPAGRSHRPAKAGPRTGSGCPAPPPPAPATAGGSRGSPTDWPARRLPAAPAAWASRCRCSRRSRVPDGLRIRGPVPMKIAARPEHHVDIRIVAAVAAGRPRPDLQQNGLNPRAVLDLVAVGHAGPEPGAVAGPQHRLPLILDQPHLAGDHPDELVLARVPVPLARPGPVGQAQQVDPELVQPDRVAQPPAPS